MDMEMMLEPRTPYGVQIKLVQQRFGDKPKISYCIQVGMYWQIATGYGDTIEDAIALAAQALINFFIAPNARKEYEFSSPLSRDVPSVTMPQINGEEREAPTIDEDEDEMSDKERAFWERMKEF